jgi:hypothetical protein
MPHMLAQEHMGIVDVLRYGTARNQTTIAAALSAIGATPATLVLSFSGDGLWVVNSALTFPANIVLSIPPGVLIGGTGNITIQCQVLSYTAAWYVGTGVISGQYKTSFIGGLRTQRLGINIDMPGTALHVVGDPSSATNAIIALEDTEVPGSESAHIKFVSHALQRGALGLSGSSNILLTLANTAHFAVVGGNMAIGAMTPTVQLELSTGGAQKATGTAWSNPSDARIKTVQRPYTDGLAVVQAMEPQWLKYNGLAGTNTELPEFVAILAQDVQPVAPYMVGTYLAKLHPEDSTDTEILNFDGSTLLWALVNAVKEQQALIVDLTARVATLEAAAFSVPQAAAAPRGQRQGRRGTKHDHPDAEEN